MQYFGKSNVTNCTEYRLTCDHLSLFQVLNSDGVEKTRSLARQYCDLALAAIEPVTESKYKWALATLTESVINRMK